LQKLVLFPYGVFAASLRRACGAVRCVTDFLTQGLRKAAAVRYVQTDAMVTAIMFADIVLAARLVPVRNRLVAGQHDHW